MPYLGNDLQVAQPSYRNIDDISGSFNSSTTSFPLLVSGSAPVPFPINSNQCLISVAGVVQRPDDSGTEGFRISGGNIIFSSAPSTGADFFGVILAGADYVNVGANFPSGSAAVPSITFDSDLDTGIYNSAANQVSITTAGIERLRIDSAGQIESVSLGSASAPAFSFTTDPNTGIYSPGADQVAISTNGVERVKFGTSEVVFNDGNNDYNFRVESDNNASLLFVDASTDRFGIGHSSPATLVHVADTLAGSPVIARIENFSSSANSDAALDLKTPNETYTFKALRSSARLDLETGGTPKLSITSAGLVGIGTTSPNAIFHTKITTDRNLLFNTNLSGDARITALNDANSANVNFVLQGDNVILQTGGGTARIDSSGRLLVGTSTARSIGGATPQLQVEGTSNSTSSLTLIQNANTNAGAYIFLGKSRGTSSGSVTAVSSGDTLGGIYFNGANGSNLSNFGASIEGVVDGTVSGGGTNDMPGRLVFSTTADGASSPTERMRIAQNGVTALFSSASSTFIPRSSAAADTSNFLIQGTYGATNTTNGTVSFQVFTNGNVQNTNNSYGAISDIKLKENIVYANPQWDDLKALQVRKYNFKEGQTHTQIGLIAQEVELVSPGLVTESPDRDEDGNDLGTTTKSVNYSVLYMKAVKALQEAMERIETLEASNADLLARVSALESA